MKHPMFSTFFAFCFTTFLLCLTQAASADLIRTDVIRADDGRTLSRTELIAELMQSDFILLGERHDNSYHHVIRGELIDALAGKLAGRKPSIVMEYLDRATRLDPALPLLEEMQRAGFNLQGWQWPLHEPLFAAARSADLPILGGNLSRSDARRVAMQGDSVLDGALAGLLARAPLRGPAQQRLDADLVDGHCGHLPASRLPNMRLAQRARDAAMVSTLLDSRPGSVILLAGNGHVRRDYGVAALLHELAPTQRSVSIGFFESNADLEHHLAKERGVFDYVWITPPAERDDPCAGFSMPAAKVTTKP
jgi:uncharacterized iron-regulated protein